jgi:hypothetical protein
MHKSILTKTLRKETLKKKDAMHEEVGHKDRWNMTLVPGTRKLNNTKRRKPPSAQTRAKGKQASAIHGERQAYEFEGDIEMNQVIVQEKGKRRNVSTTTGYARLSRFLILILTWIAGHKNGEAERCRATRLERDREVLCGRVGDHRGRGER